MWLLAVLLRLPLIVTVQGEQVVTADHVYQRSSVQRWVCRRILRRADVVTGCSTNALLGLGPYGVTQKPPVVIPNGADFGELGLTAARTPHARPYIFAAGRHVWEKGFDVLVRAFAQLAPKYPDLDLIIAGDGPDRASLMSLAEQLKVAYRIVFPGMVDRAGMMTYNHYCRFHVCPSIEEPFGIVIAEALAASKAVVASRVGGIPDFIDDGRTGLLVPPNDVDALSNAMQRLLDQPALAGTLANAGAALVRERYSWDSIGGRYLSLYMTTLEFRGLNV
jgi:glycogen(starch) synthase